MRGPFFTEAELCRALALKQTGLTFVVIAERFGRPYGSLIKTLSDYRRGRWKPDSMRRVHERNTRMIADAEAGLRLSAIAKRAGVSLSLASVTLSGYGLDGEMRRAIRDELQQA